MFGWRRSNTTAPPHPRPQSLPIAPIRRLCTACGDHCEPAETVCPACDDAGRLIPDLTEGKLHQAGRQFREVIARGRRTIVFLAEHTTLKRREAVKVMSWEEGQYAHRALRKRVADLASLRSDRAARVYDCIFPGDMRADLVEAPMVFMEYVEGPRLEQLLDDGPLDQTTALRLIYDLAEALGELHARGIALGRIDLTDVIVETDARGRKRARLVDLGLAEQTKRRPPKPADDVRALGDLLGKMLGRGAGLDGRPASRTRHAAGPVAGLIALLSGEGGRARLRDARAVTSAIDRLGDSAIQSATAEHAITRVVSASPGGPAPSRAVRPPRTALGAAAVLLAIGLGAIISWGVQGSDDPAELERPAPSQMARGMTAREDSPERAPAASIASALNERATESVAAGEARATRPPAGAAVDEPSPAPTSRTPSVKRATHVAPVVWPEVPARMKSRIALRRGPMNGDRRLYVGRTEISHREWKTLAVGGRAAHPDHPVQGVSPGQAAAFSNRLSVAEGLTPCYASCSNAASECMDLPRPIRPCSGYRLLSTAEWRQLTKAGRQDPDHLARLRIARDGLPCRAGADALDVCDLYGGVFEWTESRTSSGHSIFRVGGSWEKDHRGHFKQPVPHAVTLPNVYVGLRVAREVEPPCITHGELTIDPLSSTLVGPEGQAAIGPRAYGLVAALFAGRGIAKNPPETAARALTKALDRVGLGDQIQRDGEVLSLALSTGGGK